MLEATFTAASVRYVRVETTNSPSWVAWAEIEVYGAGGSGNGAGEVNWIVTDHIGTPHMIADQSGSGMPKVYVNLLKWKVSGGSFSGGDMAERSDKLRLPLCISSR